MTSSAEPLEQSDTIFALSTGAPPAAIAIIRISGPHAEEAVRALCGAIPPERQAVLRTLRDPQDGDVLDEALVLFFGRTRSATGEALIEIHCHGGRAVVAGILKALAVLPGLRPALAGEFTRRALANGRMDLNAVEGLSDLLHAETEMQRRAAFAMYGGAFTARIRDFEERALQSAALIEAVLDFADEEDVGSEDPVLGKATDSLRALLNDLDVELAAPPAERLREGIRLVIAGPVNSGKSTLLNRLAGYEAAIVTDIPGTTRDRIETPVSIGGTAWLITDTAGFRDSAADAVERIGMDRARDAIHAADLLLWLGEPNEAPRADAVLVLSRVDLPGVSFERRHDVAISVHTGEGMDSLLALMAERAATLLPAERSYFLSERQRAELSSAAESLRVGLSRADPLMMAEHVRDALSAFDRLTGRASTENMLDRLFGGFCIGK